MNFNNIINRVKYIKILALIFVLGLYLISVAPAKAFSCKCGTGPLAGLSNCACGCFTTACSSGDIPNDCATNNSGNPCNDPNRVCQAEASCGSSTGCARDPTCVATGGFCPFCSGANGPCFNSQGQYLGRGVGICDLNNGNCFTSCNGPICSSPDSNPHQTCVNGSCQTVSYCGTSDCSSCATHKACSGPLCVIVPGSGSDTCNSDPDCIGPQHKACSGNSCVIVSGSGSDTCNSDPDCAISTCSGYFCSGGQCRQRNPGCDSSPAANNLCNNGNGCGGCTQSVGLGAGCDLSAGICCSSGSCSNGQCRNTPPPTRCDPLGIITGTPNNGSINLPPDVTLSWQTNEDPNRGACSGSGRQFELWYGSCPTSAFIDPSNTTNPDHCTQDGYINGRTNNFTCGSGPGANFPVGYNLNQTLTGLSSGWHYWQAQNNCSCHWCQTGAPPVSTCVSGNPTDRGCPANQIPGAWMFRVGNPAPPKPANPTLICQTVGTSGDIHDICDKSVSPPINPAGPPTGFGNASRYNLNARDNGPGGARHLFYQAHYFLTNLTTGQSIVPPPIADTTLNQLLTIDGRTLPLVNGQRYSWYVMITDAGSPPNPTPDSLSSANWEFLYDTSSPNGGITGINDGACYDPTTLPSTFSVNASDPIPGGSPNEASGLKQALLSIQVNSNPSTIRDVTTTCSGGPGIWSCSSSFVTNPPSANGDIYSLIVNTADNAGNNGTSRTTRFIYKSQCIGPWLQTTSGDVHSNDKVNTPGGPN